MFSISAFLKHHLDYFRKCFSEPKSSHLFLLHSCKYPGESLLDYDSCQFYLASTLSELHCFLSGEGLKVACPASSWIRYSSILNKLLLTFIKAGQIERSQIRFNDEILILVKKFLRKTAQKYIRLTLSRGYVLFRACLESGKYWLTV